MNQSTTQSPPAVKRPAPFNWKCEGCGKLYTDKAYEKADRSVQGCSCGEADFSLLPRPVHQHEVRGAKRRAEVRSALGVARA